MKTNARDAGCVQMCARMGYLKWRKAKPGLLIKTGAWSAGRVCRTAHLQLWRFMPESAVQQPFSEAFLQVENQRAAEMGNPAAAEIINGSIV